VSYWEILCHFFFPENVSADSHVLLHSKGGVRATTRNDYISPLLSTTVSQIGVTTLKRSQFYVMLTVLLNRPKTASLSPHHSYSGCAARSCALFINS